MPISPLFKIQVEQDIGRCENQKAISRSEGLCVELVNRYSTLIEDFMQKLPTVRKPPTSVCGADYRPELQLIASKLRTYLLKEERKETEISDNPIKAKVDNFIQRGIDIGRMEFHPAGGGFPVSYVSGPLYDAWMGACRHFTHYLHIYNFLVHNFHRICPDIIHFADPCHLISSLQFLGNALGLDQLLDDGIQQLLCLLVNIGEVAIQLATYLQTCV